MPVTISAPTETKIRRFRISIDGVFNAIKYLIRLRTICVTLRVQSRVSCGLISLIPLELKRPLARHSAHLISLNLLTCLINTEPHLLDLALNAYLDQGHYFLQSPTCP